MRVRNIRGQEKLRGSGEAVKLVSLKTGAVEEAAIVADSGPVLLRTINRALSTEWSTELHELLRRGQFSDLKRWYDREGRELLSRWEPRSCRYDEYAPLYRFPRKICGIGMNYIAKAEEMNATPPEQEPICFIKPDTSLIGAGEAIVLPGQSERVTAEAELGIVIGKTCKNIGEAEAPFVTAGFTTTLDMTAQDIHARNPRFLGRSKYFDTFFSFGPFLITPDELPGLEKLAVETGLNGQVVHRNTIANMIYSPWFIVSYFSKMMTLLPGDVIMTGTPGSVAIREGDVAECRIDGFEALRNPVIREA
ncbi:fumarylacetoacetate hydrolase family protein [Paenibacillus naphthalenovorans]|uniref:fumarylacetoacetate hydrolase family protein n=1 Tax=Paenibacillus naphthalenovorans TaxID=162209 RepID=UPI003D2D084B